MVAGFPGQLAHDPAEPFDGRDNDRNGVVDDIFGPTYDPYLRPTARVNEPVSAALADINRQIAGRLPPCGFGRELAQIAQMEAGR